MKPPTFPTLPKFALPPETVKALAEMRRGIVRMGEDAAKAMRPITKALARVEGQAAARSRRWQLPPQTTTAVDARARAMLQAKLARGTGPTRTIGRRNYR